MKIYTYTKPLSTDIVDAFCSLQQDFTDQFVYYDKSNPCRYFGLGRCVAVPSLDDIDVIPKDPAMQAPVFFSFNRFDAENPQPTDELFATFPHLTYMLPEVVLFENNDGMFLQVNSLGPVYEGRVTRFMDAAIAAPARTRSHIPFTITRDDPDAWNQQVAQGLKAIESQRLRKIVLSRRCRFHAQQRFTSCEVVVNLIDGSARGTVFLYRYGDVFFCGCTPELLVRKQGDRVESMCLAGTCDVGANEKECAEHAQALLDDDKNRREHAFVVDFIRQVFDRTCYDVHIDDVPHIKRLKHVQHLCTPVHARIMDGRTLEQLAAQLHPTPALAGAPVGEALMSIRSIEPFNRGFFGGAVGVVNACGDGEMSVAIRSGVFDGSEGWVYAGCGIVAGSKAAQEYTEIDLKLKTILSAFDGGDLYE